MKSFENYPLVPNEEARKLFEADKDAYFQRIRQCVDESLERRLNPPVVSLAASNQENQVDSNCSLVFSEPQPEHLEIIKRIFYRSDHRSDHESSEPPALDTVEKI